jgi:hypothetical protein
MKGVVAARAIGMLLAFDGTVNPWAGSPTFQNGADVTDPEVKRRIIAEVAGAVLRRAGLASTWPTTAVGRSPPGLAAHRGSMSKKVNEPCDPLRLCIDTTVDLLASLLGAWAMMAFAGLGVIAAVAVASIANGFWPFIR